ncbi:unnamed protein product [Macrosiphum euphorbiae]|uniref:Uncharacterized protein n=1 Tax=Macrosiphum euphorbiae TaxID=13131 RepID=A0AAV0WZD9_9HEMI|nr:unnamed protein product [Macrosiphum euphorbiae]
MSCKKCGRDDHVKPSSSKCEERILLQKRRFAVKSGDEDVSTFTIQENFGKFCPEVELRERIKRDVAEVSASSSRGFIIYVYFRNYTRLFHHIAQFPLDFTFNHLLDFYYHLQGKRQRKERVIRDEEYFGLRQKHGLSETVYDGSYRPYNTSTRDPFEKLRVRTFVKSAIKKIVQYFYEACERKTQNWIWKLRVYEELFSPDHIARHVVWKSLIFYENSTYLKTFEDCQIRKSAGGRLCRSHTDWEFTFSERGSRSF